MMLYIIGYVLRLKDDMLCISSIGRHTKLKFDTDASIISPGARTFEPKQQQSEIGDYCILRGMTI